MSRTRDFNVLVKDITRDTQQVAHGSTAVLMMLALIVTAAANAGPLLGSAQGIPLLGSLLRLRC